MAASPTIEKAVVQPNMYIMYSWPIIYRNIFEMYLPITVQRKDVGAKLYWSKEMTIDGKVVIIIIYC